MNTTSDTEYQEERNLLDLPCCLIETIAGHLTLLDYINFRAVCRLFSLLAPTIQWRKAPKKKGYFSPWLLMRSSKQDYTLIDSKFNGSYFIKIPTELRDATIHCSRNGWLIMSSTENSLFFFNPFTREVRSCTQNLPLGVQVVSFLLSPQPTLFNYFILGIKLEKQGFDFYTTHFGDQEWNKHAGIADDEFVPSHNIPVPVPSQGSFQFLGQKGNLLELVVQEDGLWSSCILDGPLTPPRDSFHQNFLVECNEILHSIFVGDLGKWVRVFKQDLPADSDRPVWKEVNSLGSQAIFLSGFSSFSVVALSEEMENRIYFPRLHKGSLVFYSLDTRKFHTADGEDSFTDYADTMELLQCFWIEARWNEDYYSN